MATWKADVFVNSNVGRISTEVQASTFQGAKEQIYAKHGDVQQIVNLRQVSRNSSSTSGDSSSGSVGGAVGLIGLVAAGWLVMSFTPYVLSAIYGAGATWISQLLTGQSIEEYAERNDDSGHGKVAIVLILALLAGGFGFVQGSNLQKEWNTLDTPAEVQSAK